MKTILEKQIIETIFNKLADNIYDIKTLEQIKDDVLVDYDHCQIEFNINGKSYTLKLVRG